MAYTNQYEYSRRPPVPVIEMVVSNPGESPPPVTLKAIVDSGADCTVIPLEVVKRLDLPLWYEGEAEDFGGKTHKVSYYTVRISIPTLEEHLVRAIGMEVRDALAGRDILNHYKATLDGRQKKIEIE